MVEWSVVIVFWIVPEIFIHLPIGPMSLLQTVTSMIHSFPYCKLGTAFPLSNKQNLGILFMKQSELTKHLYVLHSTTTVLSVIKTKDVVVSHFSDLLRDNENNYTNDIISLTHQSLNNIYYLKLKRE